MGARRERECSRVIGGGGAGEWRRGRVAARRRQTALQFCPTRLPGVLNRCNAGSGWSPGRICAGNSRRMVRFGRHGRGIAGEEPIPKLWLARFALPACTALPPCVLSKTWESGAPDRETQGAGTKRRAEAPNARRVRVRLGPGQKPRVRKRTSAPANERAATIADMPPMNASRKARPVRPS